MMPTGKSAPILRTVVGCLALAILVVPGVASGVEIDLISGNVSATQVYAGSPTFQWDMPAAPMTNTAFINQGGGAGGFVTTGNLSWNAGLDTDLSAGGLADATFLPGGTFSISGSYVGNGGFLSGVLLQGTVSDFRWTESGAGTDNFNFSGTGIVTVTGGLLQNSPFTTLSPQYHFDATILDASQNGGPVNDFQSNIQTLASFQYLMVGVPEPTTAILMVGGLIPLLRRRRMVAG